MAQKHSHAVFVGQPEPEKRPMKNIPRPPGSSRSSLAKRTKYAVQNNRVVNPRRPCRLPVENAQHDEDSKQQQADFQSIRDIMNKFQLGKMNSNNSSPNGSPNGSPFASPNGSPFASPNGSPFASPNASPNGSPYRAPPASPDLSDADEGNFDEDIQILLRLQKEKLIIERYENRFTNHDLLEWERKRFVAIRNLENSSSSSSSSSSRKNDDNFRKSFARLSYSLCEEFFALNNNGMCLFLYKNFRTLPTIRHTALRRRNTIQWNSLLAQIVQKNGLSKEDFFKLVGPYITSLDMHESDPELNEIALSDAVDKLPLLKSLQLRDRYSWVLFFVKFGQFGCRMRTLHDPSGLYLRSKLFSVIIPKAIRHFTKLTKFGLDCNIEVLNQCVPFLPTLATIKIYIIDTEEMQEFDRFANLYRNLIESLELIVSIHFANQTPWLLFESIAKLANLNKLSVHFIMEPEQDPEFIRQWNQGFANNVNVKLSKTITVLSVKIEQPAPKTGDNQSLNCNIILNQFLRNLPNLKRMQFGLNQPNTEVELRFVSTPNSAPKIETLSLDLAEVNNNNSESGFSSSSCSSAKLKHCDFGDSVRALHLKYLVTGQSLQNTCGHFTQLEVLKLTFQPDSVQTEVIDSQLAQLMVRGGLTKLRSVIVDGIPCTAYSFTDTIHAMSKRATAEPETIFTLRLSWLRENRRTERNPECDYAPNNLHIY